MDPDQLTYSDLLFLIDYISGFTLHSKEYNHYTCFQKSISTIHVPGCVVQSVTGVASSIPARSRTFMEIDYEIVPTVILLSSPESFKKDCCQLQAKVCARSTG